MTAIPLTMARPTLECIAPAKLNLTLRVIGRRADGYHLLESYAGFCRFGDVLRVEIGGSGNRVTVAGRFAADIAGPNIVARALERYRELAGWPDAAHVRIDKRIPVAAGLGGGSADAAALLRSLQAQAPTPLDGDDIARLALTLGADVPACLRSRPVRMDGVGDRLRPLAGPVPPWHIVLVNAGPPLSSASVFSGFDGPYSTPADGCSWNDLAAGLPAGRVTRLANDLIAAAGRQAPVLAQLLDRLTETPGLHGVGMSGSGATCFGLFAPDRLALADRAAAGFRSRGWWSVRTSLLA